MMERSIVRKQKRAAILDAAARRIARDGYHGMSMRDLARATGRGLASLYTHFDSKTDLLFALQSESFQAIVEGAARAVEGARDPNDRLYAFVLHHLHYFAARPGVLRALVQEAGALPAAQRAAVRSLKEEYFALARSVVSDVAASGTNGEEIERTTYCLFGMLNWVYGWYDSRRHGPPEALARTIHRIATRGAS